MLTLNKLIILIVIISFETIAADKYLGVIDLRENRENLHNYWITPLYVAPKYPRRALERGLNGCVYFDYIISNEGVATNINIIDSFPNDVFVQNALNALRQYRWFPAPENKIKQTVRSSSLIQFQIEGNKFNNTNCSSEQDSESKANKEPEVCVPKKGSRLLNSCSREEN